MFTKYCISPRRQIIFPVVFTLNAGLSASGCHQIGNMRSTRFKIIWSTRIRSWLSNKISLFTNEFPGCRANWDLSNMSIGNPHRNLINWYYRLQFVRTFGCGSLMRSRNHKHICVPSILQTQTHKLHVDSTENVSSFLNLFIFRLFYYWYQFHLLSTNFLIYT